MRKNVLRAIFFFMLVAFGASTFAQEGTANVSGEWEVTIESPRGPMTSTAKFVQDGEKITVTMTGPRGGESTGEGTVKGNAITWTITRSTPRGEMTVVYKGTVEGTTMSGTVEMGDFGTRDWKATKK